MTTARSISPARRRRDGVARDGLDEGELDVRVLAGEGSDRPRDDRRGRGLEGADPQAPARHPRDRLDLGVGRGHAVQDGLGVPEEDPARLGEPDAARRALEQLGVGLALERGDLAGDGGLREVERLRGRGQRPAAHDLAEDGEARGVEDGGSTHARSVWLPDETSHLRTWLRGSTIVSMTVSPSLFHAELAGGRRNDDRRRVVTHRVVRPDARPRRGPMPRAHTARAPLAPG